MDSEDSRDDAAGDASSDGEASSGSDSRPVSPKAIKSGGRQFNPRSPDSADGPESPDNSKPGSYRSDRDSDASRPPSPDCPPKDGSESGARSRSSTGGSPDAGRRSIGPSSPTSPNPSNSLPASPGIDSPVEESRNFYNKSRRESSEKKWSPKSDSRSRPNSVSPDSTPKRANSPPDSPKKSDVNNQSDSSRSSRNSSPQERSKYNNPPTEEISDGDMEFEHEDKSREKSNSSVRVSKKDKKSDNNVDISHEDLSDVSDLESMGQASEDDCRSTRKNFNSGVELSNSQQSPKDNKTDIKMDKETNENEVTSSTSKLTNGNSDISKFDKVSQDKSNKSDDAEEQLDFEAEEGECLDAPPMLKSKSSENDKRQNEKDNNDDEGSGAASSLEEGELSDDEDRRPEETEPRPVCRFYSRGLCTWGVSCRFLHPGVTDKGNYTMFDMVRTMPPSGYTQHHSTHLLPHLSTVPATHHAVPASIRVEPPAAESAWERGLRTAKEMMRKACKRKEQDTDFEEKKMNLSLSGGAGRGTSLDPGEEDDPDLAAYAGFAPPTSPSVVKREREEYTRVLDRRTHYEDAVRGYNTRDRYERVVRGSVSPPPRGLPAHPYEDRLDDRATQKRRNRTTREVIVQRAPGGGLGSGRGDEWADPWMRGGGNRSPGGRRGRENNKPRKRRGRYSSGSSYSSSSSSRSSSRSSNSSARSGSATRRRRRRAVSPGKSRRAGLSPSIIVQERRAANARAGAMNPPAPSARKRAPSPAATRQNAANPPAPHSKTTVDEFGRTRPKVRQKKMYSKSSSSGSDSSSSSSDSDSDSHSSSSSDSSRARPTKTVHRGGGAGGGGGGLGSGAGGLDKKAPIKISSGTRMLSPKYIADAQKKEAAELARKEAALKKRPAGSPPAEATPAKKPVSRREELLKQLKAVEDAIARKRSKI